MTENSGHEPPPDGKQPGNNPKKWTRFTAIENALRALDGEGFVRCPTLALVVPAEQYDNLCKKSILRFDLSEHEWLIFGRWDARESDLLPARHNSAKVEAEFRKNGLSRLRSFCGSEFHAFRFWWVIEEIERLRALGDPESMKKLKTLFNAYVNMKGRRKPTSQSKSLKRDMLLFEMVEARRGHPPTTTSLYGRVPRIKKRHSIEDGVFEIAKREGLAEKLVSDSYYETKKLIEMVRTLQSNWRFYQAEYPKPIPHPNDVDERLEELFGLRAFILNLPREIEAYRQIRMRMCNVTFYPRSIVWEKAPTRRRYSLNASFNHLSVLREFKGLNLPALYSDFFKYELIRNNVASDPLKKPR